MKGEGQLYLTDRPDEMYTMTFPAIMAGGLIVGEMRLELKAEGSDDQVVIRCAHTKLEAHIEFIEKSAGFWGDWNCITGTIGRIGAKDPLFSSFSRVF